MAASRSNQMSDPSENSVIGSKLRVGSKLRGESKTSPKGWAC